MSDPAVSIPQSAPGAEVAELQAELDAAIGRVVSSGWYILGPEVEAFEREFSDYLGLRHGIGVGNGTDALELALRGVGIGAGDAVLTVSHTAVATVAAIERAGAVPVLVDVEADTYTLDPERLEDALRRLDGRRGIRPRGLVVVHLYGQTAHMSDIMRIARGAGLLVVEDCAQAHGARWAGVMAGTFGDAASFSFYPTKNLGALGDGGFVATNDSEAADRVRRLRQYGWRERYVSDVVGVNSRLDELQAAILRVKLRHLDATNARRRAVAARYDAGLPAALATPSIRHQAEHVFHQYVIRAEARDLLAARLRSEGIATTVHYPVPVHLQPAYRDRIEIPRPLEVTERIATRILSLPMFPSLGQAATDRVVAAIRSAVGSA